MSHLQIAIPCYGGQITAHCMRSVMQLTHVLRDAGHTWTLDQLLHESLVQRARNTLTMNFMKNADATHLFFIDADIQFNPHDVLGMLDADKPIVCGAYPKKAFNRDMLRVAVLRGDADPLASATEFAINPVAPKPPIQSITMEPDKGCIPVRHGATGFMLIQRTALEQMIEAHPEWLYYSDAGNNHGEPMYAVFDCGIDGTTMEISKLQREALAEMGRINRLDISDERASALLRNVFRRLDAKVDAIRGAAAGTGGVYLSEDWLFCKRWQDLGGEVWLYLAAKLGHYGNHLFQGDLFQTFVPVDPKLGGLDQNPGERVQALDGGRTSPTPPKLDIQSVTPGVADCLSGGMCSSPNYTSSVAADGGATEWCDIPSLPDSDPQKKFHVDRYKWAAERVQGKKIANAACGTNYGSLILRAGHPERQVTGYDRDAVALDMSGRYGLPVVRVLDVTELSFPECDALVSLETIEHVEQPWHWLKKLQCKELILSVPVIPTKHTNKYHLHDFTDDEVIRNLQGIGWLIEEFAYQDEYVKRAVLLVHATREAA